MRTFVSSALVVVSCLASACVAQPGSVGTEPLSEEESSLESALVEMEDEVDPGRAAAGKVDLRLNEAPCGDNTIAVLTNDRAATYVFCAVPKEQEAGALVFELLASPDAESLLDDNTDPVSLLERVTPPGQEMPEWVTESVKSGVMWGDHPFIDRAPSSGPIQGFISDACTNPDGVFNEAYYGEFPDFYDEFVYFGGAGSNYTIRSCVREHEFFHDYYITSQRTASAYEHTANGACAGYARMYSCNDWTLLKANAREGTSGAWTEVFAFWVPAGGLGKVKYYANSQHSCHPTRDKDDLQFRAESSPGAYHHFIGTFIGRTDTVGNALICNTDPV
ncbi:MAG: hypothetical protein R3B70_03710 [Polyangiaceae bacterium]